jgi:hypothetical protein
MSWHNDPKVRVVVHEDLTVSTTRRHHPTAATSHRDIGCQVGCPRRSSRGECDEFSTRSTSEVKKVHADKDLATLVANGSTNGVNLAFELTMSGNDFGRSNNEFLVFVSQRCRHEARVLRHLC